MLCFDFHGDFSTNVNTNWAKNPYNSAKGGPLSNPQYLWTDGTTISLFKRRYGAEWREMGSGRERLLKLGRGQSSSAASRLTAHLSHHIRPPSPSPSSSLTFPYLYYQIRYRYIVARWAFSTAVHSWELWNEMDWTDNFAAHATDAGNWHAQFYSCISSFSSLYFSSLINVSHPYLGPLRPRYHLLLRPRQEQRSCG